MASSAWRLPGRIGFLLLTLPIVAGLLTDHATAGRSKHLDYAASEGVDLPAPDPEHALVVFLRPYKSGGSVHASIYDGEEFVTFVQKNTCFIYAAGPGEHQFTVVSKTADVLTANLEAGKNSFAQVKPRMGMMKARFSLIPDRKSDKEWKDLPKWLEKATMATPNQSARNWYEENKSSVMFKMTEKLKEWKEKPEEDRQYLKPGDGVTGLDEE